MSLNSYLQGCGRKHIFHIIYTKLRSSPSWSPDYNHFRLLTFWLFWIVCAPLSTFLTDRQRVDERYRYANNPFIVQFAKSLLCTLCNCIYWAVCISLVVKFFFSELSTGKFFAGLYVWNYRRKEKLFFSLLKLSGISEMFFANTVKKIL